MILIIVYLDSDWNDGESDVPPAAASSSSVNVDCKIRIITHCCNDINVLQHK